MKINRVPKPMDMAPAIPDPLENLLYNILLSLPPIPMGAAGSYPGMGFSLKELLEDLDNPHLLDTPFLEDSLTFLASTLGWHLLFTGTQLKGLRSDDAAILTEYYKLSSNDKIPTQPDAITLISLRETPLASPNE